MLKLIQYSNSMKHKFKVTFLLILLTLGLKAQEKNVRGTISDDSGPIPGVSILVKNANRGTESDFDGNYSISVSKGSTLVFRYLGYKTVEKLVGDSSVIDVLLTQDVSTLDEVVVTTGYDNINKKSFTGAANTIKMEDVKIDGVVDVSRMLEGRVAVVNVLIITQNTANVLILMLSEGVSFGFKPVKRR